LDGQTFTHAVMGICCGSVAIGSGLASARKDYADQGRRWLGRIMVALGLVLAVFCAFQLPSGYRFQEKFNMRGKEFHGRNQTNPALDFHALGFDDVREAGTLFDTYRQVCVVQISEDSWEDMGPGKYSVHHLKATVAKNYKGDWGIGEKVSFYHGGDAPALTVSNAFLGSNMLLLANGPASNEIPFGAGDFFLVDTNVEQILQSLFPNARK